MTLGEAVRSGVLLLAASVLIPGAPAVAQNPDSVVVDPDSVAVPPDSAIADSLAAVADTLADSIRVRNLPDLSRAPDPVHPGMAVWEWTREDLLRVRTLTLADLLATVPGAVALRGGDYGMPRTVAPFGAAGGAVQVRIDGILQEPLVGSVPDLSLVPLVGISRVRVRRTGTAMEVDLFTLRFEDPEPISVIEVGTGDLETNLFGGTFALPRALGGSLAVSIDRVDTQGRAREEPGSRTGAWARYSWVPREDIGVEVTYRTHRVDRGSVFVPSELQRSRFSADVRWLPDPRLLAAAFWSHTGQSVEEADSSVAGPGVDQYGARVAVREGILSGSATLRLFDGSGQLDRQVEADASVAHPRYGGASAQWRQSAWDGGSAARLSAQAWTAPLLGLSAFAGIDRGAAPVLRPEPFQGTPLAPDVVPPFPLPESEDPDLTPGRVERDALRLGGRFAWRGLEVGAAWRRVEADSSHATGLPMDSVRAVVGPEGARTALEAWLRLPIPILEGLALRGWAVRWDSVDAPDPYRPTLSYDAALSFHDVFLPTGNFELLVDVGVEGRDPMNVFAASDPLADPPTPPVAVVPFQQSWYARLQMRIVTVHAFVRWENFTLRDRNQDFPERLLPRTRTTYGVRWTLRN